MHSLESTSCLEIAVHCSVLTLQMLTKEAGLKFSAEVLHMLNEADVHARLQFLSCQSRADRTVTNHQHSNSHPDSLSSSAASMLTSPFSISIIHNDYILIKSLHFNHLCPVVAERG